jgi:hypothetical protein
VVCAGALLECVSEFLTDHGGFFIATLGNAPAIVHIYLFRSIQEPFIVRIFIRRCNLMRYTPS